MANDVVNWTLLNDIVSSPFPAFTVGIISPRCCQELNYKTSCTETTCKFHFESTKSTASCQAHLPYQDYVSGLQEWFIPKISLMSLTPSKLTIWDTVLSSIEAFPRSRQGSGNLVKSLKLLDCLRGMQEFELCGARTWVLATQVGSHLDFHVPWLYLLLIS